MSSKLFRSATYLQIMLFITVFLIVLLDIRFHIQTENTDGDPGEIPGTNKDILKLRGNRIELKFKGEVKPIESVGDNVVDDSSEISVTSKYRTHGKSKEHQNEGGMKFRQIAQHDLPPETKDDWVKSDDEVPVSRFPKCLLVGFSKCGTSSLLAFLNVHPDIVSLDWETDYFCDRVYFKYSLHWYRMRMPPSTSNQVTIEKSPCYVSERQALERIKAFNSSIKVMVILRDPLTRITSQHGQYLASFKASGKPKQSLEERYMNVNTGKLHEDAVRKWGIFTSRVENLYDVFPREQIHVVDGDRFIRDPLPVLSAIERFLGLQAYFSDQDIYFDQSKGFFCPRDRSSKQTECMGYQKGRPHTEMSQRLRKSLQDYIRPHTEKLFQIIGHRMSWDLGS